MDELPESEEPLSERFPDYLAVFGVTGAVAILVGLIIGIASSVEVAAGIGYSLVLFGVLFLLAGGSRGGGYANMGVGAAGVLFGGRRYDEGADDRDVRRGRIRRTDPMKRLKAGLRPERNPSAFWQVIAGFAYIGAGLFIVNVWG